MATLTQKPGLGQRLGILGGTFDPIHHGHLVAAEEAHDQQALDRVFFVPAGAPPHKPVRPISPGHHRLRMVELAIAGKPHFAISRVDLDRSGPCYTVDTLALLRRQWGLGPSLFFIVGADSLAEMATWYQPQRLLELCELVVVERAGSEIDLDQVEGQLPGISERLHRVRMPRLQISSSNLRARRRAGRSISYLVPPAVEAYIQEHELYLEGTTEVNIA
jgi:nicotinate-nucleotide adenylyltransferase